MKKEVVLISINYRLGSLGFLSFDDPETKVSGNAALKDQVLALKWVKKNCEFFGGDSNNITVFGESAGGASTHYMMLTEQTRDLFHKGIIMSASAMAQWAVTPRRNWGFRMAQLLGYQGPNNDLDVLYFLQLQKPYDIMKAGEKLLTVEERKSRIPFAFGPVIEPFIM
uniref:Carboxylic ester hydrolase n=1 Tax=Megaselia scalaris TaxID=36166 RepID=T1GFT7_MEGSC